MKRIIGIDPGLTGALAALDLCDDGHVEVCVSKTPVLTVMRKRKPVADFDPSAMFVLLASWVTRSAGPCVVVLERASTRPGLAAQAVLRTGEGWGLWRGIIAALDIEIVHVFPHVWKRQMNLLRADKRASVLRAKEKFPVLSHLRSGDHGIADAVLIAATLC